MPFEELNVTNSDAFKINLKNPKQHPSLYAHNLVVQEDGFDIILTFFETVPPYIPAGEEEREKALEELKEKGIDAICTAKIRLSKGSLGAIVELLTKRYERIIADLNQEVAERKAEDLKDANENSSNRKDKVISEA